MTDKAFKAYLMFLAKQQGLETSGLDAHVATCADLALGDFWNAKSWSFRTRQYELTLSTEAEEYELPDDFEGFRTVRDKAHPQGRDLTYKTKEAYDHLVPRPTAGPTTYTEMFTVFWDGSSGVKRWKAKFYPIPASGTVIYFDMYTSQPQTVAGIPKKALSGLILAAHRYISKPGTPASQDAWFKYEPEMNRLERADSPFKGHIFRALDDTSEPNAERVRYPWACPDW